MAIERMKRDPYHYDARFFFHINVRSNHISLKVFKQM